MWNLLMRRFMQRHTTTNSPFSFWTWLKSLRIQLQENTSQNPKVFWTVGRVFGFWDVFWILGTVFGFWHVFWILGSVFGFWHVFCPYESRNTWPRGRCFLFQYCWSTVLKRRICIHNEDKALTLEIIKRTFRMLQALKRKSIYLF